MVTAWHYTDWHDLLVSSQKELLQTLCSDLLINLCLLVTWYTVSSYSISSWRLWYHAVFPSQSTVLWFGSACRWNEICSAVVVLQAQQHTFRAVSLNKRENMVMGHVSGLCAVLQTCLLSHNYTDKNVKAFGLKMPQTALNCQRKKQLQLPGESNILMSSPLVTSGKRKIIKLWLYIKKNKTRHLWVPSGGEYSDPDPTLLLHVCLSRKHEHPSEMCKCIAISRMTW